MTYGIWNMVTGEVNTTCPTPELAERELHAVIPKRNPGCVIVDIDGLTVTNYRDFSPAAFFEGMQRYIIKAATNVHPAT